MVTVKNHLIEQRL